MASKVASALTVGVVVVRLPSGQLKAIVTDESGVKHTTPVTVKGGVAGGRRVSWRELVQ